MTKSLKGAWKVFGFQNRTDFQCMYCEKSFKKPGQLSQHHQKKHANEEWKGARQNPQKKRKKIEPALSLQRFVQKRKAMRSSRVRKAYTTRQNQDKVLLAKKYKQVPEGSKVSTAKKWGISRQNLNNWDKHERLKSCWKSRKENRGRYCMNPNDERVLGKFWSQQRKVYKHYKYRRSRGEECDTKWFCSTMRNYCKEDQPEGYDPKKNKFGCKWKNNFAIEPYVDIK